MIGAFNSQKFILFPQFLNNGDFAGYLIYKERPESLIKVSGIWKKETNKVTEFVFFLDEVNDCGGTTIVTLYSGVLVQLENIRQIRLKWFVINDNFSVNEDVLTATNISKTNKIIYK